MPHLWTATVSKIAVYALSGAVEDLLLTHNLKTVQILS